MRVDVIRKPFSASTNVYLSIRGFFYEEDDTAHILITPSSPADAR